MKASRVLFFVFLSLILLCAVSILNVTSQGSGMVGESSSEQRVLFEDDFETYTVGSFPSGGGWELWFDGAGTSYQVVVDSVSASPTKSVQLLGAVGGPWAAFAAKPFTSMSPKIGFVVNVRVEETRGADPDNARLAFSSWVSPYMSREYAPVCFQDYGKIVSGGQVLQSYVAGRWYKVMLIMDRASETYSVWIDDVLLGENLKVGSTSGDIADYPSWGIEAFSASQCYNNVKIYFDDVRVFEVLEAYQLVPRLELVPTTGFAATTLVGSGFALNSRIAVTWDGTAVPTVPSPLISNSYGNFTAIISVLTQNATGPHVVKTIDEKGNEANATFTVTLASTNSLDTQSSSNQVWQPIFFGPSLPIEYAYAIVALIVPAVAAAAGRLYYKRKK